MAPYYASLKTALKGTISLLPLPIEIMTPLPKVSRIKIIDWFQVFPDLRPGYKFGESLIRYLVVL